MNNERYTVYLTGHVRAGFSEQQVAQALRDEAHLNTEAAKLLFDGKGKAMAADLVWNEAQRLRKTALLAGAEADVRLMLTGRTLREGTFATKNSGPIAPTTICIVDCGQCGRRQLVAECCESCGQTLHQKAMTREPQTTSPVAQTLQFNRGRLVPMLFSLARREPLREEGKPIYGYAQSLRAVLSWPAAAAISLVLGFLTQWSFLLFYAKNISTGVEGTLLSIALLVAILLLFPGWIHPARRYAFQPARAKAATLFWSQSKSWVPSVMVHYRITDAQGKLLGRMERELFGYKAYLYNIQGELLYQVKNEQTMDDAVAAAAYAIGERLASSVVLEAIVWFFGEPGRNVIMVRDAYGHAVAEFGLGFRCKIRRFVVPKEGEEGVLLPFLLLQSKM